MEYLIILVFIILPLSILIHESGHAFFVKVFQGNLEKIIVGTGKPIFRYKKLQVKSAFCFGGEFFYTNLKINNKFSRILITLGGSLFTAIAAILLYCMISLKLIPSMYLSENFINILALMSIINMLPITFDGTDTDGKQILQILKRESLVKLSKDEKNYEVIVNKINTEIARLKKASENTDYEYMKSKYIQEVLFKSNIQGQTGRLNDAINTLKEVYADIPYHVHALQIIYYNNLLYYSITSGNADNIDELYNKLIELLSIEENKVYETDAIKDTIVNYELIKSN